MEIKKIIKKIDVTLLILVVMVLVGVATAFWQGGWQLTILGLTRAGQLIQMVWLRLLLGFTLGGFIQVLIPRELIARWLGPSSGLKGILIGSYTGVIVSGGPYIILPVVASIYRAGAGVGPTIALLTGAGLLSLQGLIVWQIPFLGMGIPLARYIVCLFIPPLVGLIGGAVFRVINSSPQLAGKGDRKVGNAGQQRNGTGKTCVTSEKEEACMCLEGGTGKGHRRPWD